MSSGVHLGTLVVGAGQAGLQVASSLRELGDDRPIALVGEELCPPYERPPLTKGFLAGAADADSLAFRSLDWYSRAGIDLVLGESVTALALPKGDRPGTATTDSGRILAFMRLALTVGAAPRRLSVSGAELDGVFHLRSVDDAVAIRARLPSAHEIVVVGGGFIGLETAAVCRSMGKGVTVVESTDRLIPRAGACVVSDFYRTAHERRGTKVLLSTRLEAIEGDDDGRVSGVVVDGLRLPADLVVVGVGVVPRTELAEQIGLTCDGGVVVDEHGRTSAPGVVAAGDCTVLPHPLTGEGRVRLESVQNATAQAALAAASLLGRLDGKPAVPCFWSDQGDLSLQIAGLAGGFDRHVVRGDPDTERFSVLYYRGDQLLAINAVNTPADYMVVRRALGRGIRLPAELVGDPATPLKELLEAGRS